MRKQQQKTTDFYECKRCEIDSDTEDRMCPCPRGSCEAEVVGKKKVVTVTTITKTKKK